MRRAAIARDVLAGRRRISRETVRQKSCSTLSQRTFLSSDPDAEVTGATAVEAIICMLPGRTTGGLARYPDIRAAALDYPS
jgi:hypothetical protein